MNTNSANSGQRSAKRSARFELLITLAEHRKTVLTAVFVTTAIFFILTYLMPQTYESVATVLPPEHQGMGGMLSLLSGSSALDLLKGSDNPTLDLFKTIVESKNVATEVARDPKIRAYFGRNDTSLNSIAGALQGSVQSEALRTGMFTVTVDLKTPFVPSARESEDARRMSAYIANRFVYELDRFNRDRLMTSARNTRMFVEKEYNARMLQLDSAYKQLQEFQEVHQAISLPDQLSASVGAAAKLASQIQQLEMQLTIEQSDLNANSSRIELLNTELAAAKAQLAKYDDGGVGEYVIALKSVPALSRELANHMRETKILEQVTAYLRQQVEQEKITEQKDLPSLQPLDVAQVPLHRAAPSRSIYVVVGLILGFLIGTIIVLIRRFARDVRLHPLDHYRFLNFVSAMRKGRGAKLIDPSLIATTGGASPEGYIGAGKLVK